MSLMIQVSRLPSKEGVKIETSHNGSLIQIHFDTNKYSVRGFEREKAEALVKHSRDVRLETKDLEIGVLYLVANSVTATSVGIGKAIRHALDCLVEIG
ncbi:MAG: hypothetical protein FWC93_03050 [Defluviitaleaceae bacterium]|nr:hypothetical protein [Defluviitaleaceae bacterium]